jgi:hypothetical protein
VAACRTCELVGDEAAELGPLVQRVSRAPWVPEARRNKIATALQDALGVS